MCSWKIYTKSTHALTHIKYDIKQKRITRNKEAIDKKKNPKQQSICEQTVDILCATHTHEIEFSHSHRIIIIKYATVETKKGKKKKRNGQPKCSIQK